MHVNFPDCCYFFPINLFRPHVPPRRFPNFGQRVKYHSILYSATVIKSDHRLLFCRILMHFNGLVIRQRENCKDRKKRGGRVQDKNPAPFTGAGLIIHQYRNYCPATSILQCLQIFACFLIISAQNGQVRVKHLS